MPIYLLKQIHKVDSGSLVVRAASEISARKTAAKGSTDANPRWLDPQVTSCDVVRLIGPPQVILEITPVPAVGK